MTITARPRRRKKIRRQLRALKTLSTPIEPGGWSTTPTTRTVPLWIAVLLTGGFYAVGWFDGLVNAIIYLVAPWQPSALSSPRLLIELVSSLGIIALAVAVMWLLARLTAQTPSAVGLTARRTAPRGQTLSVALLAFGLIWAVKLLGEAVPSNDFPHNPTQDTLNSALRLLESVLSGAGEELALLAVPVLALRAAGVRWRWIYVITVVMRVSFHLYYGVPFALLLGLWAFGLVLLYQYTGRIWGLFLAHAVHNGIGILSFVTDQALGRDDAPLSLVVAGVPTVLLLILAIRHVGLAVDGWSVMRRTGSRLMWRPRNRQPRSTPQ